jgi:hypothetical protein
MEAYNHFAPTIAVIRFKRCLLALDLQSRRALLDKCIEYAGENSTQLRGWFEKARLLSDYDTQDTLRKNELRSSEFWEELFAMNTEDVLRSILMEVLRLD